MDWQTEHKTLKIVKENTLSKTDVRTLEALQDLLNPLKKATLKFSTSRVPLLCDVILTLDEFFTTYSKLSTSQSIIGEGAQRILNVINKYRTIIIDNHPLYAASICNYYLNF